MRPITWLSCAPVCSAAALAAAWSALDPTARLHARDESRTIYTDPETGRTFVPGETATDRTVYNVVGLFCAVLLSIFLGFRAKTLKNNVFRKRNFTSILVLVLFVFGIGFIFSASVVQTGQGLRTHQLCYSSAMICLVFYTGNKLTIYIFLLERARVVRAPFMRRHKDYVWLAGMFIILGGFGSIAIVGYLSPVVELSKLDGRCRIGLPPKVSFPLLCFDVAVNFLLTGLFFWLLKPVLDFHGLLSVSSWCGGRFNRVIKRSVYKRELTLQRQDDGGSLKSAVNKNIRTLLWKCLIGSTLVMLPTVGNMTQFYIMNSRELGWVCLTVCTLDISWGILIVNWLTIGSAAAERNLTSLMTQTQRSQPKSSLSPSSNMTRNSLKTDEESPNFALTTIELPEFFKAASLKDEGGLLRPGAGAGVDRNAARQ